MADRPKELTLAEKLEQTAAENEGRGKRLKAVAERLKADPVLEDVIRVVTGERF